MPRKQPNNKRKGRDKNAGNPPPPSRLTPISNQRDSNQRTDKPSKYKLPRTVWIIVNSFGVLFGIFLGYYTIKPQLSVDVLTTMGSDNPMETLFEVKNGSLFSTRVDDPALYVEGITFGPNNEVKRFWLVNKVEPIDVGSGSNAVFSLGARVNEAFKLNNTRNANITVRLTYRYLGLSLTKDVKFFTHRGGPNGLFTWVKLLP